MELSRRLVEIRENHGYSRKKLSEELGVPYGTITKYENRGMDMLSSWRSCLV